MTPIGQFYRAIALGNSTQATALVAQLGTNFNNLALLSPFAEALRFVDPNSGEPLLAELRQDNFHPGDHKIKNFIGSLSEKPLLKTATLLRRSGKETSQLFDSPPEHLRIIREMLGQEAETSFPDPLPIPRTDKFFSDATADKIKRYPIYWNTRIRSDLRRSYRNDGSYIDMSEAPTTLASLVHQEFLDIQTLLGTEPVHGKLYQLLFAMSKSGEVRTLIRKRGIFHSSMFGPTVDLLGAGNIYVQDGKVTEANLGSGHFVPDQEKTLRLFGRVLREMEIPGSGTLILDFVGLNDVDIEVTAGNNLMDRAQDQVAEENWRNAATLFFIAQRAYLLEQDKQGFAKALYSEGEALLKQYRNRVLDRDDDDFAKDLDLIQKVVGIFFKAAESYRQLEMANFEIHALEKLVFVVQVEASLLSELDQTQEAADRYCYAAEIFGKLALCYQLLQDPEKTNEASNNEGSMYAAVARMLLDFVSISDGWPPKLINVEVLQENAQHLTKAVALLEQAIDATHSQTKSISYYDSLGNILLDLSKIYTLLDKGDLSQQAWNNAKKAYQTTLEILEKIGANEKSIEQIKTILKNIFSI